MSINNLKFSILRFINYKLANEAQFEQSSRYVTNPKKTEDKWIMKHFLDTKEPLADLKTIETHFNNRDLSGRLFKHLIFSFGSPELHKEKARIIMEEVMKFYKDYPYIGALHTDVPNRLHAHFLLGMRNLSTGKKFSQSNKDLLTFKEHYHKVAVNNGLLGLKCFAKEVKTERTEAALGTELFDANNVPLPVFSYPYTYSGESETTNHIADSNAKIQQSTVQSPSKCFNIAQQLLNDFKADFNTFFEIGYMGGFYHGK